MRDSAELSAKTLSPALTAFPAVVEIQTTTVCNARCCTCPYESVYGTTPAKRMSDDLLWRILEECRLEREHISQIVPYHNNEPLSDTRIFNVLRFISEEIGASIELSTNASLLTSESKCEQLVLSISKGTVRISCFGASKETYESRMARLRWETAHANISMLLTAWRKLRPELSFEIVMIAHAGLQENEVMKAREMWEEPYGARVVVFGYLDRAGNMSSANVLPHIRKHARITGCDLNRPAERMNILSDGRAVLCSQDWRGEVVLGNTTTSSLSEIWHGDQYSEVRRRISGSLMSSSDFLCRSCKIAVFE